jgi:hypothetical protein
MTQKIRYVMIVATKNRKIAQKIRLMRNCVMVGALLLPSEPDSRDVRGGTSQVPPRDDHGVVRW